MTHPRDFPQRSTGDGRRFVVREVDGKWHVCGSGLIHVAICAAPEMADMVADALEFAAEPPQSFPFSSSPSPPA